MGNFTDETNWAARVRLTVIEKHLWWQGWLRRADVTGRFGVSQAQSSSDLQRYFELNPTAATYNTRSKRYESAPEMGCVLHSPKLDDPLGMFLGGGADDTPQPGWPRRTAPEYAQRSLVQALLGGHLLRVKITVVPDLAVEREVIPGGLDRWEGQWYSRVWHPAGGEWISLPLVGIEDAGRPQGTSITLPADPDWARMEVLKLRVRDGLEPAESWRLRMDYALSFGREMRVTHRQALRAEVLARLPAGFEVVPRKGR